MLDLALEPTQREDLVYVQEEPALDIILPQLFVMPELKTMTRGKIISVEALLARIYRDAQADPHAPLGRDYQELIAEFQPFFTWAMACWDFLLTTEGCRFVARNGNQKVGVRGDYRVLTHKDYSRLVHRIFRQLVLAFAQQPEAASLSAWIRERCWPQILETYQRLSQPEDPRQRLLTPYSYLRCVPYAFLNPAHDILVASALQQLTSRERLAAQTYFLAFHTETATAEVLGCSAEACTDTLRQGLVKLLIHRRLAYCLLRQIERY